MRPSGFIGQLTNEVDFVYGRYTGAINMKNTEVTGTIEIPTKIGDHISSGGGCSESMVAKERKFRELLPFDGNKTKQEKVSLFK